MNITFKEFVGTTYFIQDFIKIPLLYGMKIESKPFLKKNNRFDFDKINSKLREIYDENIKRFE